MIKNIIEIFYYYIERYQDQISILPFPDLINLINACIEEENTSENSEMKDFLYEVNKMKKYNSEKIKQ